MSYLVSSVEAALGVEAFDRSRRKAVLTKAGQRILDASKVVIEQARSLDRIASELRDGWEPELHVVVAGALPMGPITRCLRRFADPSVPTRLRLDVEYQEGVIDGMERGRADLALCIGFDGDGDDDRYDCIPLPEIELLLVAAPGHPLVQSDVTEQSRADHAELVVRDSSPRFAEQLKASFMGSRNVVYLSDFHSKRIALLDSAGYGWIPSHFIAEDLKKGSLQLLATEPNRWTYYPQVITESGYRLGRAGQLFLEVLGEAS